MSFFLLVFLVGLQGQAHAGPWARPAGSVYTKLGAGHFQGQADFEDSTLPFVGDAAEGYAEVGLGRGIELDSSLRFVSHRVGQAQSLGLQDLEVVAEWAPVSSREALAFTLGARLPLYRRGLQPELGPGGADLLAGFGWGRSLGPGWTSLDLQLRHRFGSPSSGVRWRWELGVLGNSPVGAAMGLEVQPAFGRTALDAEVREPSPVPRVLALSLKAFARLPRGFGLAADAGWLPSLVNDGPGVRLGAGLTFER